MARPGGYSRLKTAKWWGSSPPRISLGGCAVGGCSTVGRSTAERAERAAGAWTSGARGRHTICGICHEVPFDDQSFSFEALRTAGLRCAAGPIWGRSWSLRTGSRAGMRQAGTGRRSHRVAAAHHRRPGWGLAGTGQRPGDPVARVGLRGRSFADLIRKVRGLHARRHRGPDHRSHPDHGPENDKLLRGQPKLFGPGHDGRAGASSHPGHPGGP